ncbi:TPA: fimbrial protein [Providencia alcalifaciens]
MKLKQIIAFFGISLFSLDVLSAGILRVNLGDLEINAATQKLPQTAVLGDGWKTFSSVSNNELCQANQAGSFTFLPQINGKSTGLTFKDGSGDYTVFHSGQEGIGYVAAVRQQGTSRWYPLKTHNNPIPVEYASALPLEVQMMYVKTTSGNIEGKDNVVTNFEPINVQCMGNLDWISAVGEIQPTSTVIKWAQRTCEITGGRQSVNLGVHDIAKVRALNIGETFGHAQQSIVIDCPSQMSIFYSIADNMHADNINSNIIYLENQKEDPGFAVQVFEAGKSTPLRLGGDRTLSSSQLYSLINTGRSSEVITKTFDFKYVKTSNNVKATEGNAQVTITLVYK